MEEKERYLHLLSWVKSIVVGCLLLTFLQQGKGQDLISLLEAGPSKRSILLDYGLLDGVKVGEYADFYLQEQGKSADAVFVARGKAVKGDKNTSIWYLTEVKENKWVERGQQLWIYRDNEQALGKGSYLIKNKTEVLLSWQEQGSQQGVEEWVGDEGRTLQMHTNSKWEKKPLGLVDENDNKLDSYTTTQYQAPFAAKRLQEDLRRQEIQKQVAQHLAMAKDPHATDKNFEQGKREGTEIFFAQDPSLPNTYQNYVSNTNLLEEERERTRKFLAEKGPRWSEKMDEGELRSFVQERGIAEERRRQKWMYTSAITHDIFTIFTASLAPAKDPANYQYADSAAAQKDQTSLRYTLSLGYEYLLMRFDPSWAHGTLLLSGRLGKDRYKLEEENSTMGNSSEKSLYLGGRYYVRGTPIEIKKVSLFIGTGMRMGSSAVAVLVDANSEEYKTYNYKLTGFPSVEFGLNYRFRRSWGAGILGQYERLSFNSSGSSSSSDSGNIQDEAPTTSFVVMDTKLGVHFNFHL